jgi:uncharacterized protein (DUF983 family)
MTGTGGRPGAGRALGRALWLRCPHCGTPWPRARVMTLADRCRACRLRLDRGESDYFLGAYTVNLLWALIAAAGLAVASVTLPVSPLLVYAGGIPMVAAMAALLHPLSRLVWLAADLQFRPASAKDF